MNENSVTRDTREVSTVMLTSGSNSSEYTAGNNSFEIESQSSQGGGSVSNHKRRTKASRACDQCRKRKIRCDYGDDKGVCTSCVKNGERCTFERVPLKRGPSKGTVRAHSISRSPSGENNGIATSGASGEFPSSSRQGSVLLPPLAQYLPQPVQPNLNVTQQQQFWKVPYHEFQGQRRGSLDSLSSDISIKSMNTPHEHLFYNSPSTGHQPLQSPVTFGSTNQSGDSAYWPFRNGGGEDIDELRRRSGSYPSSSKSVSQPPAQPLQQQEQQQQQQQYSYSKSNNSFGNYGTSGFPSRQGSIISEGISPSTTALYQSTPVNQTSNNSLSQSNKLQQQQGQQSIQWPKIQPQSQSQPQPLPPPQVHMRASDKDEYSMNSSQNTKRRRTTSTPKREGKRKPDEYPLASFSNSTKEALMGGSTVSPAGFVYGQISEVQLIDTYYEFIHMGFPIIPLNKETVTNEILLVNTQPISPIHEINNYVILWFRNSLELLVRITLKRKTGHFYDNLTHNKERESSNEIDENSNFRGSESAENDSEMQAIFITALNECLQKIVDIHPSFRENKDDISPKIKIIYLCTFVLLNYILAVVGYDNSFVLGMSVTIFKDFRVFELLLYDSDEDDTESDYSTRNDPNTNAHTNGDTDNFYDYDHINANLNTNTKINDNNIIININDKSNDDNDDNDNNNNNTNTNNANTNNTNINNANTNNSNTNNSNTNNNTDNTNNTNPNANNANNDGTKDYSGDTNGRFPDVDYGDNDTKVDQAGYSIMFKRLYVLLIIFDSLQCCSYGGPKLLNVPIEGAFKKFFCPKPNDNTKWIVDQSPTRVKCILQSIKLGELLSELSMNRRSICDVSCKQLHWEINPYFEERVTDDDDEPSSLPYSFAAFIICRKKFVDCLLNLQILETAELPTIDMQLCGEVTGLLCQLTSLILQVLTVMMRINPKNCIDYNYRPIRPMEQENRKNSAKKESAATATITTPFPATALPANNNVKNTGSNDFYQKLLGLRNDSGTCTTNFMRGSISPYGVPMLKEIKNVMELVKQMPASLIGVVMTCAGMQQNVSNNSGNTNPLTVNLKSQELVVKLSNCMNDMMQITSLLNMIRPIKLFDKDSDTVSATATTTSTTSTTSKSLNSNCSVMRKLYHSRNGRINKRDQLEKESSSYSSQTSPQLQETKRTLRLFVHIGWKLLDDLELGWF